LAQRLALAAAGIIQHPIGQCNTWQKIVIFSHVISRPPARRVGRHMCRAVRTIKDIFLDRATISKNNLFGGFSCFGSC